MKSLIVPKNLKGVPFRIFKIHFVSKYRKTRKENPLASSGFVGYVKKIEKKSKGDPLH